MMTKEEFTELDAFQRGHIVYMKGKHSDEPNIPDEENPYKPGALTHRRWNAGQQSAVIEAQDNP